MHVHARGRKNATAMGQCIQLVRKIVQAEIPDSNISIQKIVFDSIICHFFKKKKKHFPGDLSIRISTTNVKEEMSIKAASKIV